MTQPSPQTIAAALSALDSESALWTAQRERLQRVANKAESLRITGAGTTLLFDAFLDAYDHAVRAYVDRCTGGRNAAGSIAKTLTAVRDIYAAEEAANLHAQYRLY